nr:hypothetical protein [Saprospiraceae bacterium]
MKIYILVIFYLAPYVTMAQENHYPAHFGDIFESEKYLLGKEVFKGDIGYSVGKISFQNDLGELREFYRHTGKVNFNINPWRDLYIKNTFFIPLNKIEEKPLWIADYYYTIGYYNWRDNSFSFGYENYQPNNFRTFTDDFWTRFKRGFLFVSYNLTFENADGDYAQPFRIDETSKIILTPAIRLHPEYPNEDNEFGGYLKTVIGGSIRYVILKNIYIEGSAWFYPGKKTKLPWDPDFTYGFGMFDWRSFKINFSYGNWIANRFPWNEKELEHHGFVNGELTLNVTYSW